MIFNVAGFLLQSIFPHLHVQYDLQQSTNHVINIISTIAKMCCKYLNLKITKSLARIQYQKLWSTLFYSCHFLFLIFHFLCKCVYCRYSMLDDLNMTIFCVKGSIHFRVISTGTRVNVTLCISYTLFVSLSINFRNFTQI